jgi:hypothetical protein
MRSLATAAILWALSLAGAAYAPPAGAQTSRSPAQKYLDNVLAKK